ncbi:MAG TPA: hypothetical protein VJZ26_02990 [Blastocatellia bacterium]|nr:hypothetical protein [Blastocatellia bacterium]
MREPRRPTTLTIINSEEIRPIDEWRHLYPDKWLFLEVTREDMWEVYEGKLIATATDPVDLVGVERAYDEEGVVTLHVRGDYSDPQPAFVSRLH